MANIVDILFQCTGWSDDRGYAAICVALFTYGELAVMSYYAISTYLSIVYWTEDLSIRVYSFLWLFIVIHMCALIVARVYHQSQFRDMYKRSQIVGIPENYRRKIAMAIKYYFVVATVHVITPVLYTISVDSVQMGDLFTFPFVDVLPIQTTNATVYGCKYIVYAFSIYFTHLEGCLMNSTILYSTGVLKRLFQILDEQVEEALVNKDEQKLKIAIKHHQELLKFFKEMESVYEKPILISIEFCGLFIGSTGFIIVQVTQGVIHPLILGLCIGSILESFATITVYCICGSNMNELHDGTLNSLFEHQSCYSRDKSFKQLILMMMTRVTIPLEFRAGSIFTINLNLLVKILKFTYSVFNLLLTSVNHKFKEAAV